VVVDDDDFGRRMLRRVLEKRGYLVEEASSGSEGLSLIQRVLPDAVMLDLRMPGDRNGLDVLRELRSVEATQAIPVLIVSASVHSDVRDLVADLGASGFIEKPVDFATVQAELERVLSS
jgi:CheY-like chemotaxis protein